MLNWSITFLVLAIMTGIVGLSGFAGTLTYIAWILFAVFLVAFGVSWTMKQKPPVP